MLIDYKDTGLPSYDIDLEEKHRRIVGRPWWRRSGRIWSAHKLLL